jgi:hypothetical protein
MKTTIFTIFTLISCAEQLPPLSEYEKQHLAELKKEVKKKNKQYKAYKSEMVRIKDIKNNYLKNKVILNGFSIYKTNAFDDGRERACYKGTLKNNGNEIIESLDLKITFFSKDSLKQLTVWEKPLVNANDEFLDKDGDDETKALILAYSGRKLPLKSKGSLKLKGCMKEVLLNWKAKDIKYELSNMELRSKLEEIRPLHSINTQLEIINLEERMNQEINK